MMIMMIMNTLGTRMYRHNSRKQWLDVVVVTIAILGVGVTNAAATNAIPNPPSTLFRSQQTYREQYKRMAHQVETLQHYRHLQSKLGFIDTVDSSVQKRSTSTSTSTGHQQPLLHRILQSNSAAPSQCRNATTTTTSVDFDEDLLNIQLFGTPDRYNTTCTCMEGTSSFTCSYSL
jgi:hypothetical protein